MSATDVDHAICKVLAVIRFCVQKSPQPMKSTTTCSLFYGPALLSESKDMQWCQKLKNGPNNVHDAERGGRLNVQADEPV